MVPHSDEAGLRFVDRRPFPKLAALIARTDESRLRQSARRRHRKGRRFEADGCEYCDADEGNPEIRLDVAERSQAPIDEAPRVLQRCEAAVEIASVGNEVMSPSGFILALEDAQPTRSRPLSNDLHPEPVVR